MRIIKAVQWKKVSTFEHGGKSMETKAATQSEFSSGTIATAGQLLASWDKDNSHCMKIFQMRINFWSVFTCIRVNTGKYGPEITSYLDTFHAVSKKEDCENHGPRFKWKK